MNELRADRSPQVPDHVLFLKMNLPEYIVESASGAFTRKVWLLESPAREPAYVAIFLDGEFYVNRMNAPAAIHELQQNGEIPGMACAFVSHVDGTARHRDLTCSQDYTGYLANDLMQWMRERHPMLAVGGHFIGGPSLGGLAAAFTALSHPKLFGRCLSQSGSFWWNDEWLTSQLQYLPNSQMRFWSSVGDKETATDVSHPPSGLRQKVSQITACKRFAEALAARHEEVHHRHYAGGHELKPWEDELPDALRWLFGRSSIRC